MRLPYTIRLSLLFTFLFFGSSLLVPHFVFAQDLSFRIEEETVKIGEEMCADVLVQNFNLIGFQFTISWDSTVLDFTRVINANVPFFLQSSYQDFPDMFRVAWINENITSTFRLPDNSSVFTLCFTPKKTGSSRLFFDESEATPLHPEFIDLEGLLNADLIDGGVTVLGCSAAVNTITQTICAGSTYEGYSQSGQYTDTFAKADGCDSVRTLNLTVLSSVESSISQTICASSSFEGYSQSGQYTDTFAKGEGCDSVRTLNLTVLPSLKTSINQTICAGSTYEGYTQTGQYTDTFTSFSGCDSTRILTLTVVPAVQSTIAQTICASGSYEGYSQSGQYTDVFISASGCDSTRTLLLTVESPIETTLSMTICEGENYGGRVQSGTYVDTYTSALTGCDSTRRLFLTVLSSVPTADSRSICEGSCLTIAGTEFCEAGTYTLNLTGASGCDSTVVLSLSIAGQVTGTSEVQICPGDFWIEGGTALDVEGSYSFMYSSSNGCDSLHTLQLSFFDGPLNTFEQVFICQGESFGGRTLPGVYSDSFTATNGCDSSHTVNLTVLEPIEREISVGICEGQLYEGYAQSGRYEDNFTTANGCDSTRILNLTVSNTIQSTITATICEGEDFEGLTATGVYENTFTSVSGCDSIRSLTLNVLPNVETIIETSICQGEDFEGLTSAGTYTNILTSSNGCDSIRTITLSILPSDEVSCQSTSTIDISASIAVTYYPNPIQTQLFIEWNKPLSAHYSILDLSGKSLFSKSSDRPISTIDFSNFVAGIYYLKIDTETGSYFAKLLKL